MPRSLFRLLSVILVTPLLLGGCFLSNDYRVSDEWDALSSASASTAATTQNPVNATATAAADAGIHLIPTLAPSASSSTETTNATSTHAGEPMPSAMSSTGSPTASVVPSSSTPESSCFDEVWNQDEAAVDCGGVCTACPPDLLHRYEFEGVGTAVRDSAGGTSGLLVGTRLYGTGSVELGYGQYVDLPDALLSPLSSATIEIWLNWQGGYAWQRIFDFGSSTVGEGFQENGETYLILTPRGDEDVMTIGYSVNGIGADKQIEGSRLLPIDSETHVVLAFDRESSRVSLYINGELDVVSPIDLALSDLEDYNNWIGRSQYDEDPDFYGTVSELRIYGEALSAAQIAANFETGPDILAWE